MRITIHSLRWIPIVGFLLFIILFHRAASQYPGGTMWDENTEGFSFRYNFWCNLLNINALNGEINSGRIWAIIGHYVLCVSILFFLVLFGMRHLQGQEKLYYLLCSCIAIMSTMMIITSYHDLFSSLASMFGLYSVWTVTRVIWTSYNTSMRSVGIIIIVLLLLNNLVYYTEIYLEILPLLQKTTMIATLIWLSKLSISLNTVSQY